MFDKANDENFAQRIADLCPRLLDGWRPPPSPRTSRYNCFAHAAGDERRRWSPRGDPDTSWWPLERESVEPDDLSLAMFERAYEAIGFVACEAESVEPDVDRIALFATDDCDVVHAARQNDDGTWTSKLGAWEDITHADLRAFEGDEYGRVARVMRRPRTAHMGDSAHRPP